MGFLNNYGVGVNQGVSNFFDQFYRAKENQRAQEKLAIEEQYRKMQEDLLRQQVAEKERQDRERTDTSEYIRGAMGPRAAGPTPTQQYMGRMQGLMREPSGIYFARSGNLANAPQQAQAQAMTEARGGAFPQQMEQPKLDMKTFMMKLIEKNPSNADKYATALSGLERTDMTDMMKLMMLREGMGGKKEIAEMQTESKEKIAQERNDMLKTLAIINQTSKNFESKLDFEAAKKLTGTLPGLKKDALTSANSIGKMQQMLKLLDEGAAGKTGQLKAFVAPYAEMFGYNSKALTDAQTFQLVAKTIAGSMRLDMVGSGQISNYENQLLQSVSGGGGTASAAAKELYRIYTDSAASKVNAYNESVDSLGNMAPKAAALWKKVELKGAPKASGKTVVERRTGKNGRPMVKYSDGSIDYE